MHATKDDSLSSQNKLQINFYNPKNENFITKYILGTKEKQGEFIIK